VPPGQVLPVIAWSRQFRFGAGPAAAESLSSASCWAQREANDANVQEEILTVGVLTIFQVPPVVA